MCRSHHSASATAPSGSPSSGLDRRQRGRRPRAGMLEARCGHQLGQRHLRHRARRDRPAAPPCPDSPITVRTVPPNRTRSPILSRARRTATHRAPAASQTRVDMNPAAPSSGQLPAPAATSGGTAPAAPPGCPRHRPPRPAGTPAGERLPQHLRDLGRPGAARMPVARQPAHVRRQHRIDHARPGGTASPPLRQAAAVTPNASASCGSIRSSARTSITTPVPSASRAKKSGACRRLRRPSCQCSQNGCELDRRHRRIKIQQHQVIPLQPGLVTRHAAPVVASHHQPGKCRWPRDHRNARAGTASSNGTLPEAATGRRQGPPAAAYSTSTPQSAASARAAAPDPTTRPIPAQMITYRANCSETEPHYGQDTPRQGKIN